MNKPHETVSRNFRFDAEAAESLEFESERKGVSLNSLVNNIFRKYAEFDRLAERTDMITLNRYLLRELLDLIPEATLSEQAFEFGLRTGSDSLLFWKKEVSIETLREYIMSDLCKYGRLAEYDMKPNSRTLVLTHDLRPARNGFPEILHRRICNGMLEEAFADGSGRFNNFDPLGSIEAHPIMIWTCLRTVAPARKS